MLASSSTSPSSSPDRVVEHRVKRRKLPKPPMRSAWHAGIVLGSCWTPFQRGGLRIQGSRE